MRGENRIGIFYINGWSKNSYSIFASHSLFYINVLRFFLWKGATYALAKTREHVDFWFFKANADRRNETKWNGTKWNELNPTNWVYFVSFLFVAVHFVQFVSFRRSALTCARTELQRTATNRFWTVLGRRDPVLSTNQSRAECRFAENSRRIIQFRRILETAMCRLPYLTLRLSNCACTKTHPYFHTSARRKLRHYFAAPTS